ncbi:MAG: hypothetical protein ABI051_02135 [Vicinamibacterales bacterium]
MAQAYEARLQRIHDEYRDKSVALVAINPNNPASMTSRIWTIPTSASRSTT